MRIVAVLVVGYHRPAPDDSPLHRKLRLYRLGLEVAGCGSPLDQTAQASKSVRRALMRSFGQDEEKTRPEA